MNPTLAHRTTPAAEIPIRLVAAIEAAACAARRMGVPSRWEGEDGGRARYATARGGSTVTSTNAGERAFGAGRPPRLRFCARHDGGGRTHAGEQRYRSFTTGRATGPSGVVSLSR